MAEVQNDHPYGGLALVAGSAALIAVANWMLPISDRDHLVAVLAAIIMTAVAGFASLFLRSPRTMVAYPFIIFVALGTLGAYSMALGTAFSGLLTIAFIFLGMIGIRRNVVISLLPAIATWMLANGAASSQLPVAVFVRLPIAVVIWTGVGFLLSKHTRRMIAENSSLHDQAFRDPLTGLHNRRALAELSKEVTSGDALVLLDLDHFKSVNDNYGHIGGDMVLSEFAALLQDTLRTGDSAVRFGGEEFLLFLPRTNLEHVRKILDRIYDRWAERSPLATFSAGAAMIIEVNGIIEAMGLADRRLYAAKSAGRNRAVLDDEPITAPAQRLMPHPPLVPAARHEEPAQDPTHEPVAG